MVQGCRDSVDVGVLLPQVAPGTPPSSCAMLRPAGISDSDCDCCVRAACETQLQKFDIRMPTSERDMFACCTHFSASIWHQTAQIPQQVHMCVVALRSRPSAAFGPGLIWLNLCRRVNSLKSSDSESCQGTGSEPKRARSEWLVTKDKLGQEILVRNAL